MRLAITRFGVAWLSVRLLAGLATTIAVTWALVILVDPADGSNRFWYAVRMRRPEQGEGTGSLAALTVKACGTRVYWGTAAPTQAEPGGEPDSFFLRWARVRALPWPRESPWPGAGVVDQRVLIARGWPSLAFFCELHGGAQGLDRISGGSRLSDWNMRRNYGRVVPFRPRWSGLLIDTIGFGAMWSVLLLVPGRLRSGLRRRRGLCPRCGYDPKGTPAAAPCPECGRDTGATQAKATA